MPAGGQRRSGLSLAPALATLSALGEETRLRILMLLAECELTVSELVTILGQSQPRVSRHLRLLMEAGLAQRHREGAWAFFRAASASSAADLAQDILKHLDSADQAFAADRARLDEIRAMRAEQAALYFAAQAKNWDRLRKMHAPEAEVEAAILQMTEDQRIHRVLDCGAGTGRMMALFAPLADEVIGVDLSAAMLSVARVNLEKAGVRNAQLRQGDIYALPVERQSCDLVLVHQVLHYLDDPARALREAARALRPSGRMIVVDFAPHEDEFLRQAHAHRRLGFSPAEVAEFLTGAGLEILVHRDLAPARGGDGKLTVSIWLAQDPRFFSDAPPNRTPGFGATEFA